MLDYRETLSEVEGAFYIPFSGNMAFIRLELEKPNDSAFSLESYRSSLRQAIQLNKIITLAIEKWDIKPIEQKGRGIFKEMLSKRIKIVSQSKRKENPRDFTDLCRILLDSPFVSLEASIEGDCHLFLKLKDDILYVELGSDPDRAFEQFARLLEFLFSNFDEFRRNKRQVRNIWRAISQNDGVVILIKPDGDQEVIYRPPYFHPLIPFIVYQNLNDYFLDLLQERADLSGTFIIDIYGRPSFKNICY